MAEGTYIRLMSDRVPAQTRLERTLREVRALEKLLGELSLSLIGSRLEGAAPSPIRGPDGLIPQIDATAREIEAELATMREIVNHIRRQI
jgi:hypothetical protein